MRFTDEFIRLNFQNKTKKYPETYIPSDVALSDFELDASSIHKVVTYDSEWILNDDSGTLEDSGHLVPEENTENQSALGVSTILTGTGELNEWTNLTFGIESETYYHSFFTQDNLGNYWSGSFGAYNEDTGDDGGYVYYKPAGELYWQQKTNGLPAGTVMCGLYKLTSNIIVVGLFGHGVYISTANDTPTFVEKNSGLSNDDSKIVRAMVLDSNGYIYIGTDDGVYKTEDNGNNWSQLAYDNTRIVSLEIVQTTTEEVLFVGFENTINIGRYDITNDLTLGGVDLDGSANTVHVLKSWTNSDGEIFLGVGTQDNYLFISEQLEPSTGLGGVGATGGSITFYNLTTSQGFSVDVESIRDIEYKDTGTPSEDIIYIATWGDGVYSSAGDLTDPINLDVQKIILNNTLDTQYVSTLEFFTTLYVGTFGEGSVYELNDSGTTVQEFMIPLNISGKEYFNMTSYYNIVNFKDKDKYTINDNTYIIRELYENSKIKMFLVFSDLDFYERVSGFTGTNHQHKFVRILVVRKINWYYTDVSTSLRIPLINMIRFVDIPSEYQSRFIDKEFLSVESYYNDEDSNIHIHLFTSDNSKLYMTDLHYDINNFEISIFSDSGLPDHPYGVESVNIINGGSGFSDGDVITQYNGTNLGIGFSGIIRSSAGAIDSIYITHSGYGFNYNDLGTININSINGQTVNINVDQLKATSYPVFRDGEFTAQPSNYPKEYPSILHIEPDHIKTYDYDFTSIESINVKKLHLKFNIYDVNYFIFVNKQFKLLQIDNRDIESSPVMYDINNEYGNYFNGQSYFVRAIDHNYSYRNNVLLKTDEDNEYFMHIKFGIETSQPTTHNNYTEINGKYLIHDHNFMSLYNGTLISLYDYSAFRVYANKTWNPLTTTYDGDIKDFVLLINETNGNNVQKYSFGLLDYDFENSDVDPTVFNFRSTNLNSTDLTKYLKNIFYMIISQNYRKFGNDSSVCNFPIYFEVDIDSSNKRVKINFNGNEYEMVGTSKEFNLGFDEFEWETLDNFKIEVWNDNTNTEIKFDNNDEFNTLIGKVSLYMKRQKTNVSE